LLYQRDRRRLLDRTEQDRGRPAQAVDYVLRLVDVGQENAVVTGSHSA
jgi:hypothetical protein